MKKSKVGIIFSALSFVPVLISIAFFYETRGPNTDIYFAIKLFTILSVIGIILAGVALSRAKASLTTFVIGLIAIIANIAVLAIAFLLLLAMGISEP